MLGKLLELSLIIGVGCGMYEWNYQKARYKREGSIDITQIVSKLNENECYGESEQLCYMIGFMNCSCGIENIMFRMYGSYVWKVDRGSVVRSMNCRIEIMKKNMGCCYHH